jgi:hypothetical protein
MSQVVISGELNYSDPVIQAQVENLTQTFENTTYISSPLYTESWLRSFVGYVHRNQDYLNVSIDTEESFINTLKEVRTGTSRLQFYSLNSSVTIGCVT